MPKNTALHCEACRHDRDFLKSTGPSESLSLISSSLLKRFASLSSRSTTSVQSHSSVYAVNEDDVIHSILVSMLGEGSECAVDARPSMPEILAGRAGHQGKDVSSQLKFGLVGTDRTYSPWSLISLDFIVALASEAFGCFNDLFLWDTRSIGCAATGSVPRQHNTRRPPTLPRQVDVTSKSPVGDISVVSH